MNGPWVAIFPIAARVSRFLMTTKCQGCVLLDLGAHLRYKQLGVEAG
jgi:hypothetical protein